MAESFLCIKKPKRCLTAYNLFFHNEREKLLKSRSVPDESDKSKQGKIGFGPLARMVSAKWKEATDEEKAHFTALAKKDRERYDKEMREWRSMQAKLEQLLRDSPDQAIAALQQSNNAKKESVKKKNGKTSQLKPPPTMQPPTSVPTTFADSDSLAEPLSLDESNRTSVVATDSVPRQVSFHEMGQQNLHSVSAFNGRMSRNEIMGPIQNESFTVARKVSLNEMSPSPMNSFQQHSGTHSGNASTANQSFHATQYLGRDRFDQLMNPYQQQQHRMSGTIYSGPSLNTNMQAQFEMNQLTPFQQQVLQNRDTGLSCLNQSGFGGSQGLAFGNATPQTSFNNQMTAFQRQMLFDDLNNSTRSVQGFGQSDDGSNHQVEAFPNQFDSTFQNQALAGTGLLGPNITKREDQNFDKKAASRSMNSGFPMAASMYKAPTKNDTI